MKLLDVIYQKPSIRAVYQPDTWKLAKRIKGLATISIKMYDKVHIKGFEFARLEKAFSRVEAVECRNIYGEKGTKDYEARAIAIAPVCGKGKVEFVFLPGSDFDMKAFQFES